MAPVVHVLLATCNGRRFLPAQWASLEAQENVAIHLLVADDGSGDGTPELLRELAREPRGAIREVQFLDEPPRGSATRSFLRLLAHAQSRCADAQWFAWCDQDDVWLAGKLAAACGALAALQDPARPALYGGRTLAVDEEGRELGASPVFPRPPCFRNALVENILGGNTMVMNRAAARLVAGAAQAEVPAHDWFTYQLVAGAGGTVLYDRNPMVRYRQHAANLVGRDRGWRGLPRRVGRAGSEFAAWNNANVAALRRSEAALSEDSRRVLDAFQQARTARTPWSRLQWLARSGVFRQRRADQSLLWAATLLGRL
jgi:glycosyltransferase involved in cell wall biosynthesis